MFFRFIDCIFPPGETIMAGTERELAANQATLYAGKAVNHLEPLDAEAKAFLESLRGGKSPEQAGHTRDQLIEEAKALGIKGAAQMKKDDLAAAIAALKA